MDFGCTHQKTLVEQVLRTGGGSVLELGMGWFSTPLLVGMKQANYIADFVSLEHDEEWFDRMTNNVGGFGLWKPWLIKEENWVEEAASAADIVFHSPYPLVFVDLWPAASRGPCIRALRELAVKRSAKVTFVMHDAEPADRGAYGVVEMFEGGREAFKYERIDRYETGPWTVAWSDHV